ncbi:hypothetical protein MPER_12784 [Moniliophthora perniciosa FA553]|nr:hypothetical protein MPER_12784 [Moniliophthora perniciosa FA553]
MSTYLLKRLYHHVKINTKLVLNHGKSGGKKGVQWLAKFRPRGPPNSTVGGKPKPPPKPNTK